MPLINSNPINPINPVNQTNNLGEDMNLKSNVNWTQSNDGIKEFNAPLNQPVVPAMPQQNPVEDISQNIDSKMQNLDNPVFQNNYVNNQMPAPVQNYNQVAPIDPILQPQMENLNDLQLKDYTLKEFMMEAIKRNASDLHLSVGYKAIVRVDGSLTQLTSNVLTAENLEQFAKELTQDRKDLDLEKIYQTDLSYAIEDRRFRVNIFKKMGVFSIVARLIPGTISTLDQLGLPPIFHELTKLGGGLVLLTGPTGSGKSTTLASVINEINLRQRKHIVTLEDPIEFVFPKGQSVINQREYGIDFDTWPKALRSILRQDPDVVLVGEMRDQETIASTMTVSETGHLVFATLHTNSASQSIDRIIDVFPEAQQPQIRAQLANVITAVISQRLVPMLKGGRRSSLEIMIANPAVKNAIREGKTYQIDNMIQTGNDQGMISMEKSLATLVKQGVISVEVAKETTIKPVELDMLLAK